MASIFSKIITGEIPSYKIAENERFYAFLDVFPLVHGHTLVVPKQEVDKLYELSDMDLAELLHFAQPLARAIEKAFPCKRCGMSVIGLEVPHAHLHLVPINTANDLNFTREKLKPSQDDLREAQEKIIRELNNLSK
jgi:histidine triad (HIT) family protein